MSLEFREMKEIMIICDVMRYVILQIRRRGEPAKMKLG